MGVRRNVSGLSVSEREGFITAVLRLKESGAYDEFVRRHNQAMMFPTRFPGEVNTQRNAAHMGPVFLPWHRRELRDFELALEAEVPGVALPYWDWAADGGLANPAGAQLWTSDLMGGDGNPAQGNRVTNGPFRNWTAIITGAGGTFVPRSPPGLIRRLGRDPSGSPTLPRASSVAAAMTESRYDAPPYSEASGRPPTSSPTFRNRLEGWLTRQGDPLGPGLHNRVHTWVGGDMLFGTSPNDPVFWLNHCNIDRIWAEWQEATGIGYEPASGGPPGHNLNDQLRFVNPAGAGMPPITPGGSLDFRALGYTYDTLPDPGEPNGGGNGPVELTVGGAVLQAAIGQAGEVDRFRFSVPALGGFVVETQGATDVVMALHGPNSDLPSALVAEDDDSGPGTNARIERTLSAGAYFVRVRHFSAQQVGGYGISVRTSSGGQPPGIPEIAVNGAPVAGSIDGNAESDLYRFRATTAAAYLIETGGTTDMFVTLFGPNSQTAQLAFDDDSGPGLNSRVVASLGIGDYFVRVRHFSPNGRGAYMVSVQR